MIAQFQKMSDYINDGGLWVLIPYCLIYLLMTLNYRVSKNRVRATEYYIIFKFSIYFAVAILAMKFLFVPIENTIFVSSGIATALILVLVGTVVYNLIVPVKAMKFSDSELTFMSVLATILVLLLFFPIDIEVSLNVVGLLLGKFLWFDSRIELKRIQKMVSSIKNRNARISFLQMNKEHIIVSVTCSVIILIQVILMKVARELSSVPVLIGISILGLAIGVIISSILERQIDKIGKKKMEAIQRFEEVTGKKIKICK